MYIVILLEFPLGGWPGGRVASELKRISSGKRCCPRPTRQGPHIALHVPSEGPLLLAMALQSPSTAQVPLQEQEGEADWSTYDKSTKAINMNE